MKKGIVFFLSILVFISCKNDTKNAPVNQEKVITADDKEKTEKQSDGLTLLKGEFLYMADAAVLQTHREVYGVVIDAKMHELAKQIQPLKKEDTDMVPVAIRGKISPKPEGQEGWPFLVEIKEIISVSPPNPESGDVIKLGN